MSILGERLDAAIKASGKTGDEIAREANVAADTVSRIRSGKNDNPELQSLIRIAAAAGTTVPALLGGEMTISAEDERELLRFRRWIDDRLATIDARQEPNAVIVQGERTESHAAVEARQTRIADQPRGSQPRIENPFGANVHLVLRAVGASMIEAGILPDDTLYAVPPAPNSDLSERGTIIACRLDGAIFVKRAVTEHRRTFLVSAHPRYRPIAVDRRTMQFEVLGVVIGRVGRVQ